MGQIKNIKLHIVTDIKSNLIQSILNNQKATMVQAASATNVGSGARSPKAASSPKGGSGGSTVRSRKGGATTGTTTRRAAGSGGPQNMWRFSRKILQVSKLDRFQFW